MFENWALTRRSNKLLKEKSFIEAPNYWFDSSLRDFAGNSNVVRTLDFASSRGSSQAILSMSLQHIHVSQINQ